VEISYRLANLLAPALEAKGTQRVAKEFCGAISFLIFFDAPRSRLTKRSPRSIRFQQKTQKILGKSILGSPRHFNPQHLKISWQAQSSEQTFAWCSSRTCCRFSQTAKKKCDTTQFIARFCSLRFHHPLKQTPPQAE